MWRMLSSRSRSRWGSGSSSSATTTRISPSLSLSNTCDNRQLTPQPVGVGPLGPQHPRTTTAAFVLHAPYQPCTYSVRWIHTPRVLASANENHHPTNSYLRPTPAAVATSSASSAATRVREPAASTSSSSSSSSSSHLSPLTSAVDLRREQDRAMDRAVRKAGRQARQKRRTQTRYRDRGFQDQQQAPPTPIYHPAPFTQLPVIPSPVETLHSALTRVDKVPKSPGFGKKLGRVRGQMFKYNFIARAQLEVAYHELGEKLEQRLKLFPRIKSARKKMEEERRVMDGEIQTTTPAITITDPDTEETQSAEIHPFDETLLKCSIEGGMTEYNALLNQTLNLIQRLKGAYNNGLQALNHSKSIEESRTVHKAAIVKMKELWKNGIEGSEATGGATQRSGMDLVEHLRNVSKSLRHLPEIHFRRNLLDIQQDVAAYLSVLPQEFFLLPEEELTFDKLRPYLPPSPPYTFTLAGAPNVGKSSLLSALSRAKVEVAPFAFTTKTLQCGHLERDESEAPGWQFNKPQTRTKSIVAASSSNPAQPRYTPAIPLTRIQLIDTPGLLFRSDAMRKPVELLSLTVMQHVNPLIIGFVMDETGQSGMKRRVQQYLRQELRKRFLSYHAPHPRASETDPLNKIKKGDMVYQNVALHPTLQAMFHQLQQISWIDILTKQDVKKKDFVKDEVLDRDARQGDKDITQIESELILNDANEEAEEDEQLSKRKKSSNDSSRTSLEPITPFSPRPKLARPEWKLNEIRQHMKRYLCDADGRLSLDHVNDKEANEKQPRRLVASSSTSSSTQAAPSPPSPSPTTAVITAHSVSTVTGYGLRELQARIWSEVDQRESARLEYAYLEMKARIIWMRGEGDMPQVQEDNLLTASPTTIELTQ